MSQPGFFEVRICYQAAADFDRLLHLLIDLGLVSKQEGISEHEWHKTIGVPLADGTRCKALQAELRGDAFRGQ